MKVADGFEPGAVIGPLIDMKAVEKAAAHIAEPSKGWEGRHRRGARRQGLQLLQAGGADRLTTDMVIAKEETFGLVAPLYQDRG